MGFREELLVVEVTGVGRVTGVAVILSGLFVDSEGGPIVTVVVNISVVGVGQFVSIMWSLCIDVGRKRSGGRNFGMSTIFVLLTIDTLTE